jgi:hypothetical protein
MMDLADPAERLDLNREHVELAVALKDPVGALRGHMRMVIDALELGQLAVADNAIDACANIAQSTGLPHHHWRVATFRVMRATMTGRFEDAERYLGEAERISRHTRDPNADRTLLIQR